MSKENRLTPPKPSTGDTAHLVTSGILSLIPGAPELFRRIVAPPLEKRQYEWMQEVANAIERIEAEKGISLEDLTDNEEFISVVLQTTYVAIRNHHEVKRRALANCILNAAVTRGIETDLQLIFVRYVDELSPSHITLLQLIKARFAEVVPVDSYESFYQFVYASIANPPTRDVFKMMSLELQGRGLIRISQGLDDFYGLYEPNVRVTSGDTDMPRIVVSEVGQQFLDFISSGNSVA